MRAWLLRLPLFRRLSWQLAGVALLLLLTALSAFGALAWRAAAHDQEAQLGVRLVSSARLCALELARGPLPGSLPGPQEAAQLRARLAALAGAADLERLLLLDLDGGVLVDSLGQSDGASPYTYLALDPEEWSAATRGEARPTLLFPGPDGRSFKSAFAPVRGPDGKVAAVLRAEASAGFLEDLAAFRERLLALGGLCLVAALLLTLWLTRPLVRPLTALIAASQRVSSGDFEARVPEGRHDELGQLSGTFNAMAGRLQAFLRQRERLAALGEVAAGMAHEIRNPLAAMEGYAQLAQQRLKGRDPRAAGHLREVRREVAVVDGFIQDFLAYARPRPPQPAPCNLAAVADEAARVALPMARRRRWGLRRKGLRRLALVSDAGQLRQVLVNLLANAREAQPKGGWVELGVASSAGWARVWVRDGGPGIPLGQRESLFKPFQTTKAMGTGLGLSIAQTLAEGLGGRIELDSVEGGGSCFTLLLPLEITATPPDPLS